MSKLTCIAMLAVFTASAQDQPPPPPPTQLLNPNQLANLVAPIALYPDPLLSQILVAATYPLEVVQAFQWIQRNPGLQGPALTQAAGEQNWDPSIQALVVFPDVLKRLNDDVTWTTNLGNAFLAQQGDVMGAVQQLRAQAQQAGQLTSNPQQQVIASTDNGAPVIEIEPVNPAVIYVPVYNPVWFWGPALYYPYPGWYYPARPVGGLFFSFGAGISIGAFFGGGWGGWGGWGWHPAWGSRTIIVNNTFIHRYNFNTSHLASVNGTSAWSHDSFHREGVPYPNRQLTQQYRAPVRENIQPRAESQQFRSAQPTERMGNRDVPANTANRGAGAFTGIDHGAASRQYSDHGYSSLGAARTNEAPRSQPARSEAPRPAPARNSGGERRK